MSPAFGARRPGRPQRQGDRRGTSASTSRCRSASPRSTRPSAAACEPASCCSSAARRAPARRRWPSRWRATSRRAARPTSSTSASSTTSCTCSTGSSRWSRRSPTCPHKTGAIKIQDVRKEILGTWMAEGGGGAQLANNPRLRPSLDRIARYGQNLFLLRGSQTASTIDNMRKLVQQHQRAVGRPAPRRLRRLPAEGPADPGARERDGEGHLHRQRPQGHRPGRGRADDRASSPPTRKA